MTKSKYFFISTMIGVLSFVHIAVVNAKPAPKPNVAKLCTPAFLKVLTKKDKKSRKQAETLLKRILPTIPLSQFFFLYTQEFKKKKKSSASCHSAAQASLKKKDIKDDTATTDAKKSDEVSELFQELDKEQVTVETEQFYTPDEEAKKEEHGFKLEFSGKSAWDRLTALNLQQAISIQATMSCGFFRQGGKNIGDTIRLGQEMIVWFYLFNEAKGFMGCPTASAAIRIFNKAGKMLKEIQTPIDWNKTKWKY